MKTLLYAAFLMLSVQLNAQVAYYSDEVKAKMDQIRFQIELQN